MASWPRPIADKAAPSPVATFQANRLVGSTGVGRPEGLVAVEKSAVDANALEFGRKELRGAQDACLPAHSDQVVTIAVSCCAAIVSEQVCVRREARSRSQRC
jgi:hypothetical protein